MMKFHEGDIEGVKIIHRIVFIINFLLINFLLVLFFYETFLLSVIHGRWMDRRPIRPRLASGYKAGDGRKSVTE